MIRKHKKFRKPKKAYDINRIKQENIVVEKYGLKNKREIWKAKAKLDSIRRRAKKLINESEENQEKYLNKLKEMGFKVKTMIDVLALTEEDILKRRLQTIVFQKGIATTPRGARQLIVHKHIRINEKKVNIPSYLVPVEEENKISKVLKNKAMAEKKENNREIENENNQITMEVSA
ncbi:MAG: 30S ribosomal protein S4 [Candidatus Pacearchaeota archaeon]